MIIGALHVERVTAFEPKHDPMLVVHAHGMETSKIAAERVQPISARYLQVIEPRYGVNLIQFAESRSSFNAAPFFCGHRRSAMHVDNFSRNDS